MDEMCGICHRQALEAQPVIALACGHAFHAQCVYNRIKDGRKTKRISFEHMNCPICKQEIELKPNQNIPLIQNLLQTKKAERAKVEQVIEALCRVEGLDKRGRVATQGDAYFQQPV